MSTTATIVDTADWADRCSHAAFHALTGKLPSRLLKFGVDVLDELRANGYEWDVMMWEGTVAKFCAEHPTGSWVIFTKGHAMALVDGVLVDTMGQGANRRKVTGSHPVTR